MTRMPVQTALAIILLVSFSLGVLPARAQSKSTDADSAPSGKLLRISLMPLTITTRTPGPRSLPRMAIHQRDRAFLHGARMWKRASRNYFHATEGGPPDGHGEAHPLHHSDIGS